MAEELADIQATEASGIVDNAPIPETMEPAPEKAARPEKSAKSDKSTLRQTLEKSVETVREAEAKADKAGRLHAADGKFAPKEKTVEAQDAPVEIPAAKKDAQPKEPSTAIGPPPGWSAESKAVFAALPDPVKQDILKREKEVSDGFKSKSEEIKRYSEIDQVLAPVRPVFQQAGINEAEGLRRLLSWEGALRNPATRMQAYAALGRQYGIDHNSPQSQAQPEIPDQLRPVYDNVGQLTQTVNTIQGELQRSREEAVSRTLTDFAKDKPHFETVRTTMGQLIAAGIVAPDNLSEAYRQACASHPEIGPKLIKEQADKQAAELLKNQTQRIQTARSAAISPSGRAPNGPAANGKDSGKRSVRDTIMSSVKELQENRA